MSVRASMSDLITETRFRIADPAGASQFFSDQQIQNELDNSRDDIRYLQLEMAPTILNAASTNNIASVIFADYYSRGYEWWEADVVIQGINVSNNASWVVLTPVSSDLIVGHWTFESNIFTSGTAPGQYPPVYATGKVYDLNCAAADLLQYWAMNLNTAYDITVDGQGLRRSQLYKMKMDACEYFRRRSKPKIAKMVRGDLRPETDSRDVPVLNGNDILRGWNV